MKFINREKELKFLKKHFEKEPNNLLFIYGPKSGGKSSLLDKTAEELDIKKYAVNFLDLRQVMIYNFKTFLDVFFPKRLRDKADDILNGVTLNFGFFSVKKKEENSLRENPFGVMVDKLISANKRGMKPIIIIDEIQLLKNIWLNGERYLIDELFNLFIALTKVKHLAHVVLATSDSYFIEEIYNSAKLSQTSKFFLIEHFNKKETETWLKTENFTENDIALTWKYLEGSPWETKEVILRKDDESSIEDICLSLIKNKEGKIFDFKRKLPEEDKKVFNDIAEHIINSGYYIISDKKDLILENLLKKCVELDIWFYKVEERKIVPNCKSIYWALKRL